MQAAATSAEYMFHDQYPSQTVLVFAFLVCSAPQVPDSVDHRAGCTTKLGLQQSFSFCIVS